MNRVVMAAVVTAALAAGTGTALAGGGQASGGADAEGLNIAAGKAAAGGQEQAGVGTPARADASTTGPRVVRPYQPVEIGQGAKMGLLPEGKQNYVVAWNDFEEAVQQAKSLVGDDIRPNSLSGGMGVDGDDVLFTGAFRTDEVPARITLCLGTGAEVEAGMLRLPGRPGWGTYYHDAAGAGRPQGAVTVTAYGADGSVLADLTYDASPASR
ncbi:hypothetical protein [Streptomyces sp. NPDC059861]|uniref:hypothetical protein n=1 Tax=Streptomyces sp. NPDC059861 TaxID=3346974 RepID=UPI00364819E0